MPDTNTTHAPLTYEAMTRRQQLVWYVALHGNEIDMAAQLEVTSLEGRNHELVELLHEKPELLKRSAALRAFADDYARDCYEGQHDL